VNPKEVRTRIKKILADYEKEAETGHIHEDRLLWEFVESESERGNEVARILLDDLESKERTRWYE